MEDSIPDSDCPRSTHQGGYLPELLQKNLNLYYLHDDLAHTLSLSLAQSLGVEQITVDHLINIGKTLSQSWNGLCGEYQFAWKKT